MVKNAINAKKDKKSKAKRIVKRVLYILLMILIIAILVFVFDWIIIGPRPLGSPDTQRRDDIAAIATAVTQYQSDHGGKLPTEGERDSFLELLGENLEDPVLDRPYMVSIRENSGLELENFELKIGEVVVEYGPGQDCEGENRSSSRYFRVVGYLENDRYYCADNY